MKITRSFLLALVLCISFTACDREPERPHGTVFADGSIRGGQDTVWVRDNATGDWLLYYMMMQNSQMSYRPAPYAVTYHHVITGTTASAPLRSPIAQRARVSVAPTVRPYTGSGTPWTTSPSTSALSAGRSTYTPKTTTYKPSTSAYRPSTSTTYRSYTPSTTFRSSPSVRIR